MTEERLWVSRDDDEVRFNAEPEDGLTEYVRADILESRDKEISDLKADLLKKTEALKAIVKRQEVLPTSVTDFTTLNIAQDALDTLDQKEEGE